MTYLQTIKDAHDLVCKARNLLEEAASDMAGDTDVYPEVDAVFQDWTEALGDVEDQLFTGCNLEI